MPIDGDVPMCDQLARLRARLAPSQPMDDIVEPALQQGHQSFAGVSLAALGAGKVTHKLTLQHSVVVLDLLLLTQVDAIVRELAAARLIHAGRNIAALDCALGRITTGSLEKQLQPISATESADRSSGASHSATFYK